jgi:hypothetical protein
MIARITIAPRMPHWSTLACASAGTAKYWKSRMKTKRLSTESDSSTS